MKNSKSLRVSLTAKLRPFHNSWLIPTCECRNLETHYRDFWIFFLAYQRHVNLNFNSKDQITSRMLFSGTSHRATASNVIRPTILQQKTTRSTTFRSNTPTQRCMILVYDDVIGFGATCSVTTVDATWRKRAYDLYLFYGWGSFFCRKGSHFHNAYQRKWGINLLVKHLFDVSDLCVQKCKP